MTEKFDLVLVGTGFASSFFLKKYLEKNAKKKVLVLERGNFIPHYKRIEINRAKAFGDIGYINSGSNSDATLINTSKKPWLFDPNFGGSSNCWTGCTPRFMPEDFKLESLYGQGVDWPLTYTDIESYYQEAEELMLISGPDSTPFPKTRKYPLPPHSLSSVDQILQNSYGDLYISQPTARASKINNSRGVCCTSSFCHLCPVNAKFTIENSLLYTYESNNVEIRYNSQVVALNLLNNIVAGVEYYQNNILKSVMGEVTALGTNAIFNAHILLNSGDSSYYTGKCLAEQKGAYAYVYLDGLKNTGGSSIITANGYMLYEGIHRKEHAACLIESHNDYFIRNDSGRWREIAKFKFIFEELPKEYNQVLATDNIRKPKIIYKEEKGYAKKGLEALSSRIDEIFKMLPVETIALDNHFQPTESHILGTARMSKDSETGVVDQNQVHHKYRNLFVLGGSSFPTIGPSNPTLTISALSLYAADKSF